MIKPFIFHPPFPTIIAKNYANDNGGVSLVFVYTKCFLFRASFCPAHLLYAMTGGLLTLKPLLPPYLPPDFPVSAMQAVRTRVLFKGKPQDYRRLSRNNRNRR